MIVQHVAPSVQHLGFSPPGRTMRRIRDPFIDVIDFRCDKYGSGFNLALGCSLRQFVRHNPKPLHCLFDQHFYHLPRELFDFQTSVDEQVTNLTVLQPLFVQEVQRWFGLLADIETARESALANKSPEFTLGLFPVPSPHYNEIIRQLDLITTQQFIGNSRTKYSN